MAKHQGARSLPTGNGLSPIAVAAAVQQDTRLAVGRALSQQRPLSQKR